MEPGNVAIQLRSGKRPKVRERSGNLCRQGNLIVAVQQLFICDVQRIWINKCAFV